MFYELHAKSAFSFLSAGSLPEELILRASALDMPGIALLDRDTVSGAVRFHLEAKEQGIKAIIGSEITLEDKAVLPLMPLNLKGYQNLCKLITTIKLRNPKGEHFAFREDIEQFSEGLLCLTGGEDGFLCGQARQGKTLEAMAWLHYVFGNRLYAELQRNYSRVQEDFNQQVIGVAKKLRVPLFASNGVAYADRIDRQLMDVFTCIKNHYTIAEAGKLLSRNSERCLKSEKEMQYLFADLPETIGITEEIASRIEFSMADVGYTFPDYPVPSGETMDSFLRKRTEAGAVWRYGAITPIVREKLEKELRLIEKLKMAGYFLLVWDISEFCRKRNILSQGRGSAANSVVCYALGITAVDPIEGKLLFERFLSEERGEYPDIDIDLPSGDDRESVIQYVYEKYGERGAGMTANVITYKSKSAVREVGKVFGFPEEQLGRLSKLISHHDSSLEEQIERFRLAGFYPEQSRQIRNFITFYARILNYPRHLGQHSGGMVISLGRLDGVVPIEPASMEGRRIIQWDKDDCAELGIVKVDLLGLGMMAAIRDTLTIIEESRGETVDLAKIPKDDPLIYETLQKADTVGMFQVESRAQMNFLPKAKPETFYDLVVQVAIIRPGPIVGNMLNLYLKRRQGLEPIDYMHPSLQPVLERTLGVPLFQEQVLKIGMEAAGLSGGEAEELRRALGFKRADKKLKVVEEKMRRGMTERGLDAPTQEKIIASVYAFANYGFPESHAASFALLTYASAYLKVHYLDAFVTAMLNNYPLGFYSPATLIKDAERHGTQFLPIHINRSKYLCEIEKHNEKRYVRLGLKYVKGLQKETVERIVEERETNGFYTDTDNLISRVREINRKESRSLALAGALRFFRADERRNALWQIELAVREKGSLFTQIPTAPASKVNYFKEMNSFELMEKDYQLTGLTLGKHPMEYVRAEMNKRKVLPAEATLKMRRRDPVTVAGAVIVRQRPETARGVLFITLEDETGFTNVLVQPDLYEKYRSIINENGFLLIKGVAENETMVKGLYFEPLNVSEAEVRSYDYR
jgi:error-prone DNA polymerase